MASPVPFIQNVGGQFQVTGEARSLLNKVRGKLAIVCVAGPYRTGKSFLLNTLVGKQESVRKETGPGGFQVGGSVRACTKGIWLWGEPVRKGENTYIFMDSEGLGSTDQNITFDTQILSLAILLSSFFILNTQGTITEQTLSELELVVKCSERIRATEEKDANELANIFPDFLWVLRDFALQLQDEHENPISAKEYLENSLRTRAGAPPEKNRIREAIKNVFHTRDCRTLVRPITEEDKLQKLPLMPWKELRPEFRTQVENLCSLVYSSAKPKQIEGGFVNGAAVIGLAEAYVQALNTGKMPVIHTAWQSVVMQQSAFALDTSLQVYEETFARLFAKGPVDQERIYEEFRIADEQAMAKLKALSVGDEHQLGEQVQKLVTKATAMKKQRADVNSLQSKDMCSQLIDSLWAKSGLENKEFKSAAEFEASMQALREAYFKQAVGPSKDEVARVFFDKRQQIVARSLYVQVQQLQTSLNTLLAEKKAVDDKLAHVLQQAEEARKQFQQTFEAERKQNQQNADIAQKQFQQALETERRAAEAAQKQHQQALDARDIKLETLQSQHHTLRETAHKTELEYQAKLHVGEREARELAMKLDALNQSKLALQKTFEQQSKDIEHQQKIFQQQKQEMEQQQKTFEQQRKELKQQLKELNASLDSTRQLHTVGEQQYRIVSERLQESEKQHKAVVDRLKETEQNHKAVSERLKETEQQYKVVSERLKETDQLYKAAGERIKENEQQYKAVSEKLQETDQQYRVVSVKLKETEQQSRAANERIKEEGQHIKDLNSSIEAMKQAREASEKEHNVRIKELNARLEGSQKAHGSFEKEAEQRARDLEAKLVKAERIAKETQESLHALQKDSELRNKDARSQLQELNKQLEMAHAEEIVSQKSINDLEAAQKKLIGDLNKVRSVGESQNVDLSSAHKTIHELQETQTQLSAELAKVRGIGQSKSEELKSVQKTVHELQEAQKKLNSDLSKARNVVEAQKEEIVMLRNEQTSSEQTLQKSLQESHEAQKKLAADLSKVRSVIDAQKEELVELRSEKAAAEQKLIEARGQFDKTRADLDTATHTAEAKVVRLERQLAQSEKEKKEKSALGTTLEHQIAEAEQEKIKLIAQLSANAKEYEAALNHERTQNEKKLAQRLDAVERQNQVLLEDLKQKEDKRITELERSVEELQKIKSEKEETVVQKLIQIGDLEKELSEAKSEYEHFSQIKSDIEHLTKEKRALAAENTELKATLAKISATAATPKRKNKSGPAEEEEDDVRFVVSQEEHAPSQPAQDLEPEEDEKKDSESYWKKKAAEVSERRKRQSLAPASVRNLKAPEKCTIVELMSWLTSMDVELPATKQKKEYYVKMVRRAEPELRND